MFEKFKKYFFCGTYTAKIGCLRIITAKIRENRFLQNPIFAVNFAQTFLQ
jgi:hypothetical protein